MRNYFAIIVCALATVVTGESTAQSSDITQIEQAGDKIIVHYNLKDDNGSNQYLISLFTSQDNFTTPLVKVTGDVGTEVKSGLDKKIVWDATKELGSFKGDISFEIRGRVFVPFVKIRELNEGQKFKRGKSYPLVWTSGNLSGQVNIDLYKGEERISGDNNQPNVGKFDWYIPGSVKKGKDYRLKFTNAKDRNDFVYSLPFAITPKTPFILKALGVVVVGGGIAFLAGGSKTSPSTSQNPVTESPLPSAPDHP